VTASKGIAKHWQSRGIDSIEAYTHTGTAPWKNWTAELMRGILSQPNRPTAVFAGGVAFTLGVIQAATALGLEIPRELSIIGFDDPAFDHMSPP